MALNPFSGMSVPQVRASIMRSAHEGIDWSSAERFDQSYYALLEECSTSYAQAHDLSEGYTDARVTSLRDVVRDYDFAMGIAFEAVGNGAFSRFGAVEQNPGRGSFDGRLVRALRPAVGVQLKIRGLAYKVDLGCSEPLATFPIPLPKSDEDPNLLNLFGFVKHPNNWDGRLSMAAFTSRELLEHVSPSARKAGRVTLNYTGPNARSGVAGFLASRTATPYETFLRVQELLDGELSEGSNI